MYNVEDILYVTIPDTEKVIPVMVVEITTIKTVDGENVKYKVALPSDNKKTVFLSKFKNIFKSIEDAKAFLKKNADKAIELIINESIELKNVYFDNQLSDESHDTDSIEDSIKESIECNNDDGYVKIQLGDGRIGRIKPDFDIKEINEENTASWRI